MKKLVLLVSMSILLINTAMSQEKTSPNPFFSEYTTPFKVPPFDLIQTNHYLPAVIKGIAEQQAEIDAIVNNPASPDFVNTIVAYDKSGKLLDKVSGVFGSLNGANTNTAMQAIARQMAPLTTTHSDNISLNDKLFQRIKTVYLNRDKSNLDADQKRVVEKYYSDFVRNGADLNATDKEKLRALNQKLSVNGIKFGENLLSETNTNFNLVIDNQKDLDGLPKDVVEAAATTAKEMSMTGKWVFTLQKPSMLPFLQYAKNRSLREKLYRGYFISKGT